MYAAIAPLCVTIEPSKEYLGHKLVSWAVDEPDTVRAYTGLVLGAVGLSLAEVVAKQLLGCPLPGDPGPETYVAPSQAVRAYAPRYTSPMELR